MLICINNSCTKRAGKLFLLNSLYFDFILTLTYSSYVCDCAQLDSMTGVWLHLFLSASNSLQCVSLLFFSTSLSRFSRSLSLLLNAWTKDKQKQRRAVEAQQTCCSSPWHLLKVRNMNLRIHTSLDDKRLSFTQKGLHFSELKPRTV